MLDGKVSAVFSWHDLRHAFAERNAGRGLVWLRDRLGHSGVAVTERYLRNVLNADTREM
jgi:integrase